MKALIIFTLLFVTLLARTRYHLIEVEDKNEESKNERNENENGKDDEKKHDNDQANVHHERKVDSPLLFIYESTTIFICILYTEHEILIFII